MEMCYIGGAIIICHVVYTTKKVWYGNLLYSTCVILHPCYILKKGDVATSYIAHVWYNIPAIYHKKVWYRNMLYAQAMKGIERCRKRCANQAVFLGPVVGGGRVAGSTMHLQAICCSGRTVVLSAAAHWTSHCWRPAAALCAAGAGTTHMWLSIGQGILGTQRSSSDSHWSDPFRIWVVACKIKCQGKNEKWK